MGTVCSICEKATDGADLCRQCAGLLRWIRGYFAHVPDLPSKITPATRFQEDLGVDSLDWMHWPMEAEEKLGVAISDRQAEQLRTVGQFIRALRNAGAEWPKDAAVRLLPRRWWWSGYRWAVVKSVAARSKPVGTSLTVPGLENKTYPPSGPIFLPEKENFYSALKTNLSAEQVARLYVALGWKARKCTWRDYEVVGTWCELVVEDASPILMHGNVADLLAHADELIAPLRTAGVTFSAECYGPDGELLRELFG